MLPFFTIGHSTRKLGDFTALLRGVNVKLLVDVRSIPRSRTNAQYNRESLPHELAPLGIEYQHMAALGGLRERQQTAIASLNTFWNNASFRNYADYTATDEFQGAFRTLRHLGHGSCCAIMCAEAVWWRCHRRIIADYLVTAGETVFHIMGRGRIEPARLTSAAHQMPNGVLVYPKSAHVPEPHQ
ncbi:DUF488 family protein [Microvirga brassicacearum]|uniref:DUF488 domain-containing protein n=1 Tax=Microvirga brassicacearum TaxID=2580413 RepID=A0A5N3P5M7_9HYPH|nr:DUF488 domain-containing protein [Microvirga brassicacearum]KAB0265005.1 DUF488 domain-containing protein [Microvirga brassicacearum]